MTGIIVIFLICIALVLTGKPGHFDPRKVSRPVHAKRCACRACSGPGRVRHYRG